MKKIVSFIILCSLILIGCGSNSTAKEDDKVIRIGATAVPHAEILENVKDALKKEGYTLEIQVFDDYILPNTAVEEGTLDANFFQHQPYLDSFNEEKGTHLVSVQPIHFEPYGIYSNSTTKPNADFSINDVKDGAIISVPDDPTNEARALQLLADRGIIELKPNVGLKATKADIISNPKNVDIKEVAAETVPATLPDVDFAIINGNFALTNKVVDKFIVGEDKDSDAAKTFANVLVVKEGNEKSKKTEALIKALTSEETKEFIKKTYGNLVVPVF